MICPKCGKELNDSAKFCSGCGEKIVKMKYCTNCGSQMPESSNFCGKCGYNQETGENPAVIQDEPVITAAPAAPVAPVINNEPAPAAPVAANAPAANPSGNSGIAGMIVALIVSCVLMAAPFLNVLNILSDSYTKEMKYYLSEVLDKDKNSAYMSVPELIDFYEEEAYDDINSQVDGDYAEKLIKLAMALFITVPYVLAVVYLILAFVNLAQKQSVQRAKLKFWRKIRGISFGVLIPIFSAEILTIALLIGYEMTDDIETIGEQICLSPLGMCVQAALIVMIILSFVMAGIAKRSLKQQEE